ncbi:MAG: ATP-binding protein, partial [Bacteroidota bacterium]
PILKYIALKEIFSPQVDNLFTVKQRAIYLYSLLVITACAIVCVNRLLNQQYFLVAVNILTILALLLAMFLAYKRKIVWAALMLSLTMLTPATWVIENSLSRLVDNGIYLALVPIVNLFLIKDKRISFVVFLIATIILGYYFEKTELSFLPFLTIFSVHMVYFFFFSMHIDQIEAALLEENKRKEQLILDLEEKNQEIEQLNHALSGTNKTLEEKVQDIKQFAYLSSHNLQTPLHNIQVYANLLKKQYAPQLDDLGVNSIEFLSESSTNLSTILHGLVDYFATFENYQSETLDVNSIIAEILVDERASMDKKNVVVEVTPMPNMQGNRMEIKRLFHSLIHNAIIHNTSVSRLRICLSAYEEGQTVHFCVEDNGVGIPAKDHEKVFKIYVSSIGFNRGMGLAIAKKIVANYKGEIWIDSEVKKGTTVRFFLKKLSSA